VPISPDFREGGSEQIREGTQKDIPDMGVSFFFKTCAASSDKIRISVGHNSKEITNGER
jgi:hypothetical protein